jgi:4-amino-4-deoxy-L-arabinose transferase-like glycosyltransferase
VHGPDRPNPTKPALIDARAVLPVPSGGMPRVLVITLAALTAIRLVIVSSVPLGDDEAFYWDWSRHLAAGYVDHPPMIAYLLRFSTHLLGSTPLAVHGTAVVLLFIASLSLWFLAREVLDSDAGALWSVILFNVIPMFSAGGMLAAPDAPLGVCWILTLLWTWRAAHRPGGASWFAAGLWLGLGLDSKYTEAVLPFCIGLWLLLTPSHRRWLSHPAPYAGLALAAVLFSPVVWWNAVHDWASFSFTFVRRPSWTVGGNFPVFLLLQFAYLAPLMFPALLWAMVVASMRGTARRAAEPARDRWLFLAATSVPLVAGMFAASLAGHVKGHWPAPGYISAAIALAGLVTERSWAERTPAWRAAAAAVGGTTALLTVLIVALPELAPIFLPPRLDPTLDSYGWPQAVRELAAITRRDGDEPSFVMADRYQIMAQFDFAAGGRYRSATLPGEDQYALWAGWPALVGRDGLYITDMQFRPEIDLSEACRRIDPVPPIHVERRGVVVKRLGVFWCRGFLGSPVTPRLGPRWGSAGGTGWRLTRSSEAGSAP